MLDNNYKFYLGCLGTTSIWTLLYLLLSWIPYDNAFHHCGYNMHVYFYAIGIISAIQMSILVASAIGVHVYFFVKKNDCLDDFFQFNTVSLLWFSVGTILLNTAYFIWGIQILATNDCIKETVDTTITLTTLSGLSTTFGLVIGILLLVEKTNLISTNNQTVQNIADHIEESFQPPESNPNPENCEGEPNSGVDCTPEMTQVTESIEPSNSA